ncbi:hypothetical protein B0T20DRAFT_318253, partial [Sordaria brevicollis]
EGAPRPAGQPQQVSRLTALHQRMQGKWYWRVPPNHSKPIYQFLGIGLGASMWFWVRFLHVLYATIHTNDTLQTYPGTKVSRITGGRHHQSSF